MYLNFFGFNKEPFQTTPDAAFLFLSESHKEALASIIYGIKQRKGFVAIIGEVGVGKTTILRSYLETVDKTTQKTVYIFNPKVTFETLLITILKEFGVDPVHRGAAEMVSQLHELLVEEYRRGSTIVLIIDEAHNIPVETLEGIRMLSNLETSTEKLIQIVLVGQPELDTLLNRKDLRQVRDRIAVRARILPLTRKESLAYVQHRLAHVSNTKRTIFATRALDLIVNQAQGIPRRLNILCDNALVTSFGYKRLPISRKVVKEVIADLCVAPPQVLRRSSWAFASLSVLALAVPSFAYLVFGMNAPWLNPGVASPDRHLTVVASQSQPLPEPPIRLTTSNVMIAAAEPIPTMTAETPTILAEEKAELSETARLLAVLLDAGRVVVGKAQPAINNPRLQDKGFSSTVFESQLRQEFLLRTGHDLRNLAPAPMPEHAKPLLVRLAFVMQKAVQEVQPEINKKGIGFKGFIPATFGTKVADRFSKDTALTLRQIGPPGVAPRNPGNRPDHVEVQALETIQKNHPRVGDHVVEQQLPDNGIRVLLPLFYKKQCLACHGKPKGEVDISGYEKEGFKEGDLGGAISVSLPGRFAKAEAKAEVTPEIKAEGRLEGTGDKHE